MGIANNLKSPDQNIIRDLAQQQSFEYYIKITIVTETCNYVYFDVYNVTIITLKVNNLTESSVMLIIIIAHRDRHY